MAEFPLSKKEIIKWLFKKGTKKEQEGLKKKMSKVEEQPKEAPKTKRKPIDEDAYDKEQAEQLNKLLREKNKDKQAEQDLRHSVGGFDGVNDKQFNINLSKKLRIGEKLTGEQGRTLRNIQKKLKGRTQEGEFSRSQLVPKDVDLKPGDIIQSKTNNFLFKDGKNSAKGYLENSTDEASPHLINVQGKLENAEELSRFGKKGQVLTSRGSAYRVKDVKNGFHQTDKDKLYGGPDAGKKFKEVLLEQMSIEEFNALSPEAKKKVIKNVLSAAGVGVGLDQATNQESEGN